MVEFMMGLLRFCIFVALVLIMCYVWMWRTKV